MSIESQQKIDKLTMALDPHVTALKNARAIHAQKSPAKLELDQAYIEQSFSYLLALAMTLGEFKCQEDAATARAKQPADATDTAAKTTPAKNTKELTDLDIVLKSHFYLTLCDHVDIPVLQAICNVYLTEQNHCPHITSVKTSITAGLTLLHGTLLDYAPELALQASTNPQGPTSGQAEAVSQDELNADKIQEPNLTITNMHAVDKDTLHQPAGQDDVTLNRKNVLGYLTKLDHLAREAIANFKTATQKKWEERGEKMGWGYAVACGMTIFSSVFLTANLFWSIPAYFLSKINYKVNWENLGKPIAGEMARELFGGDHLLEGLLYYVDEASGKRVKISKLAQAGMLIALAISIVAGLALSAVNFGFIAVLAQNPLISLLITSWMNTILLNVVIVTLAVVFSTAIFFTEAAMLLVAYNKVLKEGNPWNAAKAYFHELFSAKSPLHEHKSLTQLWVSRISIAATIILASTAATLALYFFMATSVPSLAGIFMNVGMSAATALSASTVISLYIGMPAQLPFSYLTSFKFGKLYGLSLGNAINQSRFGQWLEKTFGGATPAVNAAETSGAANQAQATQLLFPIERSSAFDLAVIKDHYQTLYHEQQFGKTTEEKSTLHNRYYRDPVFNAVANVFIVLKEIALAVSEWLGVAGGTAHTLITGGLAGSVLVNSALATTLGNPSDEPNPVDIARRQITTLTLFKQLQPAHAEKSVGELRREVSLTRAAKPKGNTPQAQANAQLDRQGSTELNTQAGTQASQPHCAPNGAPYNAGVNNGGTESHQKDDLPMCFL